MAETAQIDFSYSGKHCFKCYPYNPCSCFSNEASKYNYDVYRSGFGHSFYTAHDAFFHLHRPVMETVTFQTPFGPDNIQTPISIAPIQALQPISTPILLRNKLAAKSVSPRREMAAKETETATMKQLITELDQRISSLSGSGKLNDHVKNVINPIVERAENMYRKAVKSLSGDKRR